MKNRFLFALLALLVVVLAACVAPAAPAAAPAAPVAEAAPTAAPVAEATIAPAEEGFRSIPSGGMSGRSRNGRHSTSTSYSFTSRSTLSRAI